MLKTVASFFMASAAMVSTTALAQSNAFGPLAYANRSLYAAYFNVDDTYIYKIDANLGSATQAARRLGEGPVAGLVSDGYSLYFSENNVIFKTSFSGESQGAFIFDLNQQVGPLVFTNSSIYAANLSFGDNAVIYKLDSGLRTAAKQFERLGEGPISGLATDGASLYFSERNTITKTSFSGESQGSYIFDLNQQIGSLVFTDNAIYAADYSYGDNTLIYKLDNGLRTAAKIVERLGEGRPISGLATDGSNLYFSEQNTVYKTTMSGRPLGEYSLDDQPSIPAPPSSAVPEPATWALMLTGFGAIGYGLRRRKSSISFA